MEWAGNLVSALVMLLVCGALGALVPTLIGRLPEPAPDPEPPLEPGSEPVESEERPPKETYAAMAALPRLAAKTAVVSGVVGALCGLAVEPYAGLLPLALLVPVGVALGLVDWRTTLLPTRIIAPSYGVLVALVLIGTALDGSLHDLERAGFGWLLLGGVFLGLWLVYPRGMGYGDVRLSGLLGITLGFLGWPQAVVGLYAAFLLGGVGGGLLSLLRIVDRKRYPFGPFMLLGALVGVLAGPAIVHGLGLGGTGLGH